MGQCVIVAIPEENDYVWKVSSEEVPHMTMLFLGETENISDESMARIAQFLQHVSDSALTRFWMTVDYRGKLGEDNADVLFFMDNSYNTEMLKQARAFLLQNADIAKAHASAEQFPDWRPHLTLGYPATPAKPDEREYPGFHGVAFDRVALWVGEFEGPEFRLKEQFYDDVPAMHSDITSDEGFLSHYGVRGMKWGVRRADRNVPTGHVAVTQKKPGAPLKARGGTGVPAHEDAMRTVAARQQAKASGIHALSNDQLQQAVRRMQLEKQYKDLSSGTKSKGRKFAEALLGDLVKQKGISELDKMAEEDQRIKPLADALKNASKQGGGKKKK